ncbi:hypothetical protein RND71_008246 [Anisodus tanguticus]|uniref:Uncharacterized protein n=1 Tax=Anisodus tanguticus TaxID=243964 RepID=A0AAE1VKU8_9SOLA|nr:hypothetical protein RND71_008246 [Anisodus tanguticus]
MSSEPKRRKIDGEPPRRAFIPPPKKIAIDATSSDKPVVIAAQTNSINPKIQQARNFAVAQAHQDGCTGNFRIFDSPFGNFLVPVIPTRAELGG